VKRSLVLSVQSFDVLAPAARAAEKAGLDRVWVTETPGRDAITRAVHVARETASIAVGTGIAYAFTRHPIAMASAAIEAGASSGHRITFSIGAGPVPIRKSLGIEFDHPAARLAEYIAFVRSALDAQAGLQFQGRFYSADLPAFANPNAATNRADVYGSGVNPMALTAVAAIANGITLHPLALYRRYFDEVVLPAVTPEHGKAPKLASWCVASIDADREKARGKARTRLAQYLSTKSFTGVFADSPWSAAIAAIQAESTHLNWARAGRLIPDGLLDEVAVAGTAGEVADRIADLKKDLSARGVDELALQIAAMGGTDSEILEEITVLANALA
jgi:alkanesulfonate monooxygenase SsuD/methylene tetrahydromethanopterin reductase-like flavin-dependent oxidoreductase (luciferase family)